MAAMILSMLGTCAVYELIRRPFTRSLRTMAPSTPVQAPGSGNPEAEVGHVSDAYRAITWDTYFMAVAFLSAHRSKDPHKQVGACIVGGRNKIILGIGYNGMPREANALLNTNNADLSGASVYVTMYPCNECAKLLIQAGIKEVVYHEVRFCPLFPHGIHDKLRSTHVHCIHAWLYAPKAKLGDVPNEAASLHTVSQQCSMAGADSANASNRTSYVAAKTLFEMAGVTLRQFKLQPFSIAPL